jgi:lipopolysaccharide export system permease protein
LNTLQRYIFRRIAVMTVGSFGAVLGVVWVTQVLTQINFATVSGQSLSTFMQLVLMLVPQLMALLLPIGVVIGTVQVFMTMNADSELAVMSASGASRFMIAKPVLFLAAIASVFVLFSNHLVEPRANRALRDIVVSARADLLTNLLRDGVFTKVDPNMTIYIDQRLPGNQLSGIMVSDTRDEKLSLLYYAQSGAVGKIGDNDVLVMTNGQIHRKNVADGALSIIRFNSYAISLSQFASAAGIGDYAPFERETAYLLNPDPNDRNFKSQPGWLKAEFHRRMTDWMYAPLFAMIALVIAGQTQSHRQTRFNAFFLAVGGSVLYRWLGYVIYNSTRQNADNWWLFYAVPAAAVTANALMYRYGITVSLPEPVIRIFRSAADSLRQFRIRAARARTA